MLGRGSMRMQKEEKIVMVLLLMALGSLAAAFWAFGSEERIDPVDEKSRATAEGLVLDIRQTGAGDHLIIKLDSTARPVFVSREAGAEEISKKVFPGDRVRVEGRLAEYEGSEEIRLEKAGDLAVVGSPAR